MEKSNLFKYATSELSQDAFLCWLADCANYKSEDGLQETGKQFIKMLINKLKIDDVKKVEIIRQKKHIDIILIVNQSFIIVIEDKINANEHGEQCKKYKEYVEEYYQKQLKFEEKNIFFIYLKTGNYSLHTIPEENSGYTLINRQNLLKVLETYTGTNNILVDFRAHMQNLENLTNAYIGNTFQCLNDYRTRQGFYSFVQNVVREREDYNWHYINNVSKPFWGLYGHICLIKDGSIYLQFEQDFLAIKVHAKEAKNANERKSFREDAHYTLMSIEQNNYNLDRPHFGNGEFMTIATISNQNFFGDNKITANFICEQLQKYEDLIDVVAEKL